MQLAGDILVKIPKPIDYDNTYKLIGNVKQPLDVVLLQEISRCLIIFFKQPLITYTFVFIYRYNVLLYSIFSSLEDLQKSIKGLVVMSSELEDIFICIFEGRVPGNWLKGAFEAIPIKSFM